MGLCLAVRCGGGTIRDPNEKPRPLRGAVKKGSAAAYSKFKVVPALAAIHLL
jgi:hypothetical protein